MSKLPPKDDVDEGTHHVRTHLLPTRIPTRSPTCLPTCLPAQLPTVYPPSTHTHRYPPTQANTHAMGVVETHEGATSLRLRLYLPETATHGGPRRAANEARFRSVRRKTKPERSMPFRK